MLHSAFACLHINVNLMSAIALQVAITVALGIFAHSLSDADPHNLVQTVTIMGCLGE
jgi:hypothetical protein